MKTKKVWVPCKVCIETPCTKTVHSWECVTTTEMVCVKKSIPVHETVKVCTYRCETQTTMVPVCKTKCVPVCKTVSYTECHKVCVPYQATRCVTTCQPCTETYTVCKMVATCVEKEVTVASSGCGSGCGSNACSTGCGDSCGTTSCKHSLFGGLKGRIGGLGHCCK